VEAVLVDQEYHTLGKKEKGVVRAYMCKMTGLSMPQMTRLIRQHRKNGRVERSRKRRHRFAVKFTLGDIVLLAEVDEAHERLSGPATKKIQEREYIRFDKKEYERLAGISVAHLYNLRGRAEYLNG